MRLKNSPSGLIGLPHRRRRRRGKGFLILFLLLVLGVAAYGLGGIYGGPWLIDRGLERFVSEPGGLDVRHGEIQVRPFTLAIEIADLAIAGGDNSFSADRLALDLAALSLVELRPVLSVVDVEAPAIRVDSLNRLTDLLRASLAGGLDEARIERLAVTGGSFRVAGATDNPIDLAGIAFELGAIDGRSRSPGTYRFAAGTPAGAMLTSSGTLDADLQTIRGELGIDGADVAALSGLLASPIAAAAPAGTVAIQGDFSATSLLGMPELSLNEVGLALANLSFSPARGIDVSAESVAAEASLQLALAASGIALSGRIEINETELEIHDALAMPAQDFVLADAAVLITADADNDNFTVNLGARLEGAGDTTLTIRMPATQTGTTRVSVRTTGLPAGVLSGFATQAFGRELVAGNADIEASYATTDERVDGTLRLQARGLQFAADDADAASPAGSDSLVLATALLEDSNGLVTLDLPFAGFALSPREAAAAALRARLAALSETPFEAVAALIAGEPGTASSIPFQPGDTALNDRALETIRQLATVLKERPRLGLRVHGGYDPTADRNALATQQIELHVQLATAETENTSRTVDFSSPRAQDILDEFSGERLPAAQVADLRQRFDCEGVMIPLCRRALYELLFDALVANEEIAATTLNRLGRFRAASIADALANEGLDRDRIEVVTNGEPVESPFGVGLRVELTAAGAP